MDAIVEALCTYADAMRTIELSSARCEVLTLHVLDTLGCAVAASKARPVQTAYETIAWLRGSGPCTVIAHPPSSVDGATFLNTFMARYLDFNDGHHSLDAGHPSDLIPGAIAVAEAEHRTGIDALRAISAAYGIYCGFCDVVPMLARGWDLGFTTVAAAVASGMLLKLSNEQLAHAIALAVVPHIALRATRSGELSHWKGAASADAIAHAVRASYLAAEGMTGPETPFEGRWGVFEQVSGPFAITFDPARERASETNVKLYPFGYWAAAQVEVALELRARLGDFAPGDAAAVANALGEGGIEVFGHKIGVDAYAGWPEQWAPATHETADHSLPFLVAMALGYGHATYDDIERGLHDETILGLARKIRVEEDPALTRAYPAGEPGRVRIHGLQGVIEAAVDAPRGHRIRPLDAAGFSAKFHANADPAIGAERAAKLEARVMELDAARSLERLVEV